jgi:hypothetical protein
MVIVFSVRDDVLEDSELLRYELTTPDLPVFVRIPKNKYETGV